MPAERHMPLPPPRLSRYYDWDKRNRLNFAIHILPYLRNAHDAYEVGTPALRREIRAFFEAAVACLFDRFPLPRRYNPRQRASIRIQVEQQFAADASWCLIQDRFNHIQACEGNWRDYLTIEADRERRRDAWLENGIGEPRMHQYRVAFAEAGYGRVPPQIY
ncbi:hypothetical protein ONZ45_g15340 [Pleurotus djamor]|nr:hypothetical protein ONZ45_g15340 [Pleurotus djamor]